MTFRVGQKVVCVNAAGFDSGKSFWPSVGTIYTIRRCFIDEDGDWIVWLNEIARSERARQLWGNEIGYAARRFRPVVERKTDISVFTAMLTPQRIKEPV